MSSEARPIPYEELEALYEAALALTGDPISALSLVEAICEEQGHCYR